MKRVGKPVVFIVAIVIVVFTTLSFTGIHSLYGDKQTTYIKGGQDIRWGIDIRGGVDVTFTPPEDVKATESQMNAAAEVMKQRLVAQNITDYEVYTDVSRGRIIVRFPWKEGEADFDPEAAIKELGDTAELTFREGAEQDASGLPSGVTKENIILEGKDIAQASAIYGPTGDNKAAEHHVSLKLNPDGAKKFAEATERLAGTGSISIWMDDAIISAPRVNSAITNGEAIITGGTGEGAFTAESAASLANKINSGALPFKLNTETYSTITPTLGAGALNAMLIAGVIAFIFVCIFMIIMYRLPGVVACVVLVGHIGGMIAAISGFLPGLNSFTLTIPGIAGIILSIGMGVDANVITAERIKEELRNGKSIDGAVDSGFKRGFTAIFDGNITVIIVAIILMGSFGAPSSFFSTLLSPLFFMFGPSTQGSIFSFGYTLFVGVILNFIFSVLAARLMIKSCTRFKCLRNPRLYGGAKNNG